MVLNQQCKKYRIEQKFGPSRGPNVQKSPKLKFPETHLGTMHRQCTNNVIKCLIPNLTPCRMMVSCSKMIKNQNRISKTYNAKYKIK